MAVGEVDERAGRRRIFGEASLKEVAGAGVVASDERGVALAKEGVPGLRIGMRGPGDAARACDDGKDAEAGPRSTTHAQE